MANVLLSSAQEQIQDAVIRFLARTAPLMADAGEHPRVSVSLWREIAAMGWFGMAAPEELGGAGLGIEDELVLMRQCGRFLLTPSVMATMLAVHVAASAGEVPLALALMGGDRRVSLALPGVSPDQVYAIDFVHGDLVLRWGQERCLALLDPAPGAAIAASLDESAPLTLVRGETLLESAARETDRASVLCAAQLTGIAEAALEATVGYAKTREQFGKAIGSFQAVKHKCADMAVRAEASWALSFFAGRALKSGSCEAGLLSSSAKFVAAEAAHLNADEMIQIHGGIGYQFECVAHRFMKRAHVLDQTGGARRFQALRVLAEKSSLGA